MADFFGRTTRFNRAPRMTVNGTFHLPANGDAEFHQRTGFPFKRSGASRRVSQGIIRLENGWKTVLKLQVTAGQFAGAGCPGCRFLLHAAILNRIAEKRKKQNKVERGSGRAFHQGTGAFSILKTLHWRGSPRKEGKSWKGRIGMLSASGPR